MRRVDAYLTRMAQAAWPGALVYCDVQPGRETWTLEKDGPSAAGFTPEPLGLGSNFGEARASLTAIVKAESARTGIAFPTAQPHDDGDDVIYKTQQRLMDDAITSGLFQKLADKMTQDTVKKANDFMNSGTAQDEPHAAILALVNDVVNLRIAVRTSTSILRKTLGIIYKWLPEEGQRQAKRELDGLAIQDVMKSVK